MLRRSFLSLALLLQGALVEGFTSLQPCNKCVSSRLFSTTAIEVADRIKIEQDELDRRIEGITTIASDVDGTLLSLDHTLSEKTASVIRRAVAEASKENGKISHFFPATGKSRKGALGSLGPEICELLSGLPGVFIQGLIVVDADGSVIFEQKLPPQVFAPAEEIADRFKTTIVGNDGDVLYCKPDGDQTQLDSVSAKWGESAPIPIESLVGKSFHRVMFMSDDANMLRDQMRPELEKLAGEYGCDVTQSVPEILEILPRGCSKALGVQKLCEYLGVDPTKELLAMGDAENDKGMLEMASIGVAVGNGSPIAKAAADIEMVETSCEGAAGLAMERYSKLGSNQ